MESDEDLSLRSANAEPVSTNNIKQNIPYRGAENIMNNKRPATPPEKIPSATTNDFSATAIAREQTPTSQISDQELLSPSRGLDVPIQPLANVNCQEKIVICIDVSSEMSERRYMAKAGNSFSAMDLVKRALKLFINNKQLISEPARKHSFALVLLLDQALWLTDFTSKVSTLFTQIDNLDSLTEQGSEFDMSTLFNLILEKAKLPLMNAAADDSPPYVVRTILIYGRSHCMPVFETHESQNLISGSPYFFMDIVYLHEPPSEENQSEDIYVELCELDTRGFSHIYDIPRTPTKVFDSFGKLLAHPLQRAVQSQRGYILQPLPKQFPHLLIDTDSS